MEDYTLLIDVGRTVSLKEAKQFLRVEYPDEDEYIDSLIAVAEEICENYMRAKIPSFCPHSIKQAILLIVGHFYENRETDTNTNLPQTVYDLLLPYRVPRW